MSLIRTCNAGVCALLKREQEEVFVKLDVWLENDDNWKEWSGARIPTHSGIEEASVSFL